MLPQLTHTATVVPHLATNQIEEIHRIWQDFIRSGSPKVVNVKTLYTPVKEGRLGLHKVADLGEAIKLAWLRRLPYTKSLWIKLHLEEVSIQQTIIQINLNRLKRKLKTQSWPRYTIILKSGQVLIKLILVFHNWDHPNIL